MSKSLLLAILFISVALASSTTLWATSNYVYHEASTNNPGCGSNNYRSVLTPGHNQALTIAFKAEYQNYHTQARVYYTTDGSTPAGALGVGTGTTQVLTGTFSCTFGSPVVDVVTAVIPGRPAGTTVKYIVSAWHSGGGDEIFGNGCGNCGTPNNNSSLATVFSYTVPYTNTYTFSGTGDWTDAGRWTPSYPGLSIASGDQAIIATGAVCGIPGGTTVTINGALTTDGDMTVNEGIINNGTLLQNGDITILLNGINSVGATWTVSGPNAIFFVENGVTFANLGTMNFTNDNASENSGTFTNKGSLTVDATSLFANSGLFSNGEAGITNTANLQIYGAFFVNTPFFNEDGSIVYISNSGTLYVIAFFANNANATINNNGLLDNIAGLFDNNGLYKGSGAVDGNFYNGADGIVSPGASPGCQSFTGDFVNDVAGTINLEINGTTPCTQFDQLQVTGGFEAGGTLNVDFGSFMPTLGQSFQIVTAGSYLGSFTTINETPSSIITSYSNGILTVTGAPSPGAALNFDGADDLVDLGTGFGNFGTGDFTVETWFKVAPSETGYRLLIAKRGICAHANFWVIVMNAGKIYFEIDENTAGDNYLSIATPLAYNDNNWHHVACTRSGTAMKIYMDGALVVSGNTAAPTNLNNAVSVKVGNQPCGMFAGSLDELRIWTEARSCDQINQLRSCELTGSEPNLVAYYKFNHGIAAGDNTTPPINTLTDATANANHGTLTGFALTGATSNWVAPGGVTTGTSCPAVTVPEINVQGNGNNIADGSVIPSTTDHTDFGNVAVNGSLVRTFTIYNTGSADLTVSTITSSNPTIFAVGALTPVGPISGPSGSATFTVTFLPTAAGVQNATITIANDDCDEAVYDFVVTGKGATPAAALNFDGVNDYIITTNNTTLDLSTQTVELWAKPSGSGDNDLLVGKRNYNAVSVNDTRWSIHFKNGNEGLYFFSPPGVVDWTYAFTPNQWYHIAMVTDATSTKLYIDGTFISSKATTINSPTNLPLLLGASAPNFEVFPGSLDEVRIWNTARSCDQISQLRNCELTGSESGLVAYYKFNQGFAAEDNTTPPVNTLTDATANANNGTLTGFALTGATSNWVEPGGVTTGTSCPAVTVPEINVRGNGNDIVDGSVTLSFTNQTDFAYVANGYNIIRTFTIQNTGTGAMNVTGITAVGGDADMFSIGALTPASPVPAGGSATFTVTYTPTGTGLKSTTLHIASNDCDEADYDFLVRGNTGPNIVLDFGGIPNGAIGNYYNGGAGPNYGITFNPGSANNNGLSESSNPIVNFPSGFTTSFSVYGNVQIGFRIRIYDGLDGTGTLLADKDYVGAPGYVLSATFCGTGRSVSVARYSQPNAGYDDLTFGPAPVPVPEIDVQGNLTTIADGDITPSITDHTDFGNLTVNGSLVRTFTILNTGNADLTISSITSSNSKFTVGTLTPASPIPGGMSATFTVTFNPTALGVQNATITVNNNDCNEAVYDFSVTGKGATPGAALHFDGVNDDVMIPHSPNITFDLNQDFTVSLHVKIPSSNQPNTGNVDNDIVEKVGSGGGYPYVIRYLNHTAEVGSRGKIIAARWNGSTAAIVSSTAALNDDNWHHIAFVKSGPTLYLYVDGVLNSTTPDLTTGSTANTAPLYLGSRQSQINWFNGSMDNLRIWNFARSCEEIRQQRNCELTGSESGLMAYYNFNHGFANENNSGVTTLTDAAGGDNNGTLSNNFALTGATSNWVTPGGVTTGTSCPAVVAPEADVQGGSPLVTIADGDNTPTTTDHTDFGNVAVNGSLVRTFTIYNTGNADLTINSITSSNNTLFSVGALSQASPIPGGGSASFTVTFLPTATGIQNATININTNDCDEAVYDFSVTGKGIVPGAALTLDGSDDYVNLGTSAFEFVGNFTIETWVNATLGSTNIFTQGRIMDKGVTGGEGPALDLYSGIRFISADGGSGQYVITAPTQVPANTWSHIALTIDVANLVGKIYYNGTLVHTQALSGDVAANPSYNLLLGATDGAGSLSNFFNGKLDEFRVWNRALCQDEIQAQMNCELTGSESGLMIYYNFNQGIASDNNNGLNTVNDVATGSGHGGTNNGTLTNFALSGSSSNWTAPGGVTSGVSCSAFVAPEADVQGGSPLTTINDGDNTPSTTDHTDFGNVAVNGSLVRTFTIYNTGNADLTINSITSSNNTLFSVGALSQASPIPGGGSADFTLTFNPTALGVQNATITINNNDCDEAVYDFVVTGKGATPASALDLSGSNDYVSLSGTNTLLDGATQFTIEHWIKSNGTGVIGIVGKGASGCCVNTIHTGLDAGGVFFLKVGNQDGLITGPGVVPTGTWIHLATVYNGSAATPSDRIKIYANGVLQPATMFGSIPATAPSPNVPFSIGSALSDGTFNYNGQIDEVRIWNTALNCDQINQLRNCELTGSEPGLVAYYNFNQGFANENNSGVTTLTDVAGGDHNGTLTNLALTGATSNWVTPGGVTTGTSCPALMAPEADVQGGSPLVSINDGDNTPSTTDHTDFGNVAVNGSLVRTFTIYNTGNTDLTINSITSSNNTLFSVGALSQASPIPGGGSASFTVTFLPTALGVQNATITINSNDCDEAVYDFSVTGKGATPAAALSFDGTNDYVSLPGTFGGPTWTELTIEAWVKVAATSGDLQAIVSATDLTFAHLQLFNAGSNVAFTNTGSVLLPIIPQTPTGQWRHVAMVVKSGDSRLYVDGVQQGPAVTTTFGNILASSGVSIGRGASGSRYLNGQLDEVRIWNTARTCDQITQLRNCELTGSEPGLVAYYNFNQGFAAEDNTTPPVNTLTDATANANNGTLNGFALAGATSNWVTPGGVTTGTSCPAVVAPEIDVQGGSPLVSINDGDNTPTTTDHTDFNGTFTRTFTILNTGNANLTVADITTSNPKFTIGALTPAGPISGPSGSSTFTVTYNPTDGTAQTSTITVNSDDCDEAVYDFVVTATAMVGAALDFDGANDEVTIGSLIPAASSYTKEAWVFADQTTGNNIIGSDQNPFWVSTGGHLAAGNGNSYTAVQDPTTFPTGTWVHVAVVYDAPNATMKLFKNGAMVAQNTSVPAYTGGTMTIGSFFPGSSGYKWDGKIDEVRIWSRVLCQAEIQNNMNCELPGGQAGLLAYYKFNQGFAAGDNTTPPVNTLTDATANANHGTLSGFALNGATSNWVAPGGVTTGSSCPAYLAPEIDVQGNAVSILDGDTTPDAGDHTDFNGAFTRTFTILNTGNANLTVADITTSNPKFTIGTLTPASPISGPSGSSTFTVTYVPTDGTAQTSTITINNNDCDEAVYNFVVTATATPAKALHFDGFDDEVVGTSPTAFWGTTPTTFEFWVKKAAGADMFVGDLGSTYQARITNGALNLSGFFLGNFATPNGLIPDNVWTHCAITYDGLQTNTSYKAYINGLPVAFTGSYSSHPPTSGQLRMGIANNNYHYTGSLDEVRVWKEERSAAAILANYNTEIAGMDPCLDIYWKFNQGFIGANNSTVTTATDAANAVVTNGTLANLTLNGATSNWVAGSGITETPSAYIPAPEVNIKGGAGPTSISDGDTSPSTGEGTNFGSVVINNSTTQTFTIENTGNLLLNVSGVSFTGTNAADFSVTVAPATTVAATNGTTTFTVQFAPTSTGTKTAVMHINNDDCDEADYNIAIQGTANCTAPSFTACPTNQSANVVATTCAAPVSYTATASGTPTPTITYAFSGATVATGSGTGSGSSFNKGTTTVTLTATSTCSPAATCSFTVTVTDNEAPTITCAPPVTINTTAGQCTGTTILANPTATDNCLFGSNGLSFDGVNDEVTTPVSLAANANATIEAWINPSVTTDNMRIISNTAGTVSGVTLRFQGGKLQFWGTCVNWQDISNTIIPANQWTHIAVVINGNQVTGFINGVQGLTITCNTHIQSLGMGGSFFNNGPYYNGKMDEVRFWNVARTATEIASNMNVSISAQAGLVGLYHLNQGIAGGVNTGLTTATDDSGNGNNGTLLNFGLNNTPTSNWVDGYLGTSYTNNAPATYPKGTTTVIWTATDASNNTQTCEQTVTVTDNEAPVLTAPSNQSLNVIATTCAANYTIVDPIADNCTGATWTYALSGATTVATSSAIADGMDATNVSFNKGVTTVTLNGVDAATNAAVQKTFTVTVTDNEVPKVTACFGTNIAAFGQPTGNSVTQGANSVYQSFTAPITGVITSIQIQLGSGVSGLTLRVGDGISCGGTVLGSKAFNGVGGLQTITFDTPIPVTGGVMYNFGIIGNHTAGWATTGSYSGGQMYYNGCPGSPAFPNSDLVFTVNMNYVPPISINVAPGTCAQTYAIPAPTLLDNCTGPLTWNATFSGNVNGNPANLTGLADGSPTGMISFSKGTTNVVLNGVDANGNVSTTTCPFTVTVNDNEKPQITCAAPASVNTTPGLCTGTTTLTNPTVTDNCPFGGNGLNFDGNNDRVATADYSGTALTGDLTLECWFKGTSMNGRHLLGRGFQQEFDLALWNNQLTYYHGNGSSYIETTFSYVFSDNTWYQIAVVRNATAQTVSLYVNGVFQQTLSYATLPVAQTAPFRIGNRVAGNLFLGTIDEVRVWTVARTAGQIAANWSQELSAQSGLYALYHLNEGSASGNNAGITTAPDASGNAQDGTLTNFALSGTTSNWVAGAFGGVANNAPATYPKGATVVTWTATDASGNTETCQQTVTVTDNEKPVVSCAAPVTINTSAGLCTGTTLLTEPTVTDNCPLVLGNGLHFDGSNDLVSASGLLPSSPTAFTVEFWLNPASRSDYNQEISIGSAGNGAWNGFTFHTTSTGAVYVGTDIGSRMTPSDIPNNTVVLNTWQHFAYVFSAGTGKFYKNGVLLATKANGTPPSFDVLRIASGCCNPIHGVLDELRIWNTARTQAELLATKNCELSGSESSLVAYYNFNQGTAGGSNGSFATLPDAATGIGGANNGTLTGFMLSGATSNWVTGVSVNNLSNNAPATYPKGETVVTWTATDASGNINTCEQTVTVLDNQAPTLTCPANTTVINTDGGASCQITIPNYVSTLSPTDNCTASGSIVEAQDVPAGAYTVSGDGSTVTLTYTATDDASTPNTRTCTVTITVNDDDKPSFTCPTPTLVLNTTGGANCQVEIPDLVALVTDASDNCALKTTNPITQSVAAGNYNGVSDGMSIPVTVTVTDNASPANSETCVVTFTVNDNTKPTFTCPTPTLVLNTTGGANCQVEIPDLVALVTDASDNCALKTTNPITQDIAAGNYNGVSDGMSIPVTVTVTDNASPANSETCVVTFTVNDDKKPSFTCPTPTLVLNTTGGANCQVEIPDLVALVTDASDNCALKTTNPITQSIAAGNYNGVSDGMTIPVTVTVTDNASPANSETCVVTFTVNDNSKPSFTCPTPTLVLNTTGGANCQVEIPDLVALVTDASDNCALKTTNPITQDVAAGNYNGVSDGMSIPVTVTVTDNASPANSETCVVTFTVNDDKKPSFTCPTPTLVLNATGAANCQVEIPDLVALVTDASDNCALKTTDPITQSIAAGAYNGVSDGMSIPVTVTVTDNASPANSETCVVTFTVDAPEINVQGNGQNIADGDATPSTDDHTDFGSTTSAPITRTFTIQNLGHADLTLQAGSITFNGTNANLFSISNITLPTTLSGPNGSVTFNVTYMPTGVGTHTATVNIAADDCDEAIYNFDIQGFRDCSAASFTACPTSPVTVNNDNGECSAVVTYTATADGTPSPSLAYTRSGAVTDNNNGTGSGLTFPTGTTTVTVTATNPCSAPTCVFDVVVTDNEKPTFTCPTPTLALNTIGGANCQVEIPDLVALVTDADDNCALKTSNPITQDIAAGNYNGVSDGMTIPVTVTVTDNASPANSETCVVTFTVNDNTKPTFTCPTPTLVLNTTGAANCQVQIPDLVALVTDADDNCALKTSNPITQDIAAGNYNGVSDGMTIPVTVTVTDNASPANSETCVVTFTVNDNTKPTFTCPAPTLVLNTTGAANCQVEIPDLVALVTNASDNCALKTTNPITQDIAAGNYNGVSDGMTIPVTVTVTDNASPANSETCVVTFTVNDDKKPTFTCPTPTLVLNTTGGANCQVQIPDLVALVTDANDNCALKASNPITQDVAAGNYNGVSDGMTIPVTVTVTDNASPANSETCVVTFTVNDDKKPTFTCPTPTLVLNTTGAANCQVQIPDLVALVTDANDNCALKTSNPITQDIASGNYNGVSDGMTIPVTVAVTDNASPANSESCVVTFTVNDDDAPTVTCPAHTATINVEAGNSCAITIPNYVSDLNPTDNCTADGSILEAQSIPAGLYSTGIFSGATVTVNYTATDGASPANTTTCTVTITVHAPEADVRGNSVSILDGDETPDAGDHTFFGTTTLGNPLTRTFSIHNTGERSLQVSSINSSNSGEFSVGALSPASPIPAGQSANFVVTFNPNGLYLRSSILTITTNDCDEATYNFDISGAVDCLPAVISNCPTPISVNAAIGQCQQTATYSPVINGNPVPVVNYTFSGATTGSGSGTGSGAMFNVGVTTVSFTATNACATTTCSFTVTVNDTQLPTITCPANRMVSADAGQCSSVQNYNVTANDNCSNFNIVRTNGLASGSAFPLGFNVVNWQVTDVGGNTAICSFSITVTDNQTPTITCPANIARNTDSGQCTALVNYTVTGSDDCINWSLSRTAGPGSGSQFPTGVTTVVWKNTDGGGNMTTCSFTVTVTETQAPTISCPTNIIKTAGANCSAQVIYVPAGVSDNCPGVVTAFQSSAPTAGLVSGSNFPLGVTTVVLKATDAGGLMSTCSFTVTVNDITAPTIACPANRTVNTDAGQCYSVQTYTVTVSDNCSGATATMTSGLTSGSNFPKGTTNVSWRAEDTGGRTATCSFRITVNDRQAPVITCPADQNVNTNNNTCAAIVNYTNASATDNCTGVSVIKISGPNSGSSFPKGSTNVIFRATDLAGNSSLCSMKVTVTDNQLPSITCPGNIVRNTDLNQCNAVVFYSTPTASDNCAGVQVNLQSGLASGSVFQVGTTTNTWRAMDAVNQSKTCSFTVTINDAQLPAITCPPAATVAGSGSPCGYPSSQLSNAIASDNCAVISLTNNAPTSLPAGSSTITWTAKDAANNLKTCAYVVTVNCGASPRPNNAVAYGKATLHSREVWDFSMTPNPTREAVQIAWEKYNPTPVQLCIFDAQGRLVWEQKTSGAAQTLRVEVSDWPTGVYAVVLQSAEERVTKRLVVVE